MSAADTKAARDRRSNDSPHVSSRITARPQSRRSAEAADDRCSPDRWRDVETVDDIRNEGLKRRQSLQRVGVIDVVVFDDDVDEAHTVLEPEDLEGEALGLALVQLGEHGLDQLLILLGPLGLHLVLHHGRRHQLLLSTPPGLGLVAPVPRPLRQPGVIDAEPDRDLQAPYARWLLAFHTAQIVHQQTLDAAYALVAFPPVAPAESHAASVPATVGANRLRSRDRCNTKTGALTAAIDLLRVEDAAFIEEAAKCGVVAYVAHGEMGDAQLESAIAIVLHRFAGYDDLQGAFGRRAVTERAKGILMERHSIDEEAAFRMLRDQSRQGGRKLVEVARQASLAGDARTSGGVEARIA
jgi:hypothetical protein